ncbi:LysE family translocator [Piscinibacter sp.]|uniref:LysE family translocator n=1 Tax=Piscinibacter sp. TaxID=1903157 RepID=UPI002C7DACAF|nr:LysE family translocator [Albitalea sp.]HUG21347.1 LysE family translocator [Albitalea sp.]
MTELLPLMTYSIVMSSTPGPNNILLTASGANFGYRRSLPHIAGIATGHAVQVFVTCMGLAALFASVPQLHAALRIAGAIYLVVLAWQLARSAVGQADMARPLSFRQALVFQAVNPKAWVKSITVASVFMPAELGVLAGAALATVITTVINVPCVSMWALFGVAIRRALTDARRRRVFNAIMAASLLILALTFIA